MQHKQRFLGFSALILLACGVLYQWPTPISHGYKTVSASSPTPPLEAPANPDAEPNPEMEVDRRKLLGVWQDEYKGKRTMTLHEDGTGTMLVELSGLQAALFASRLRFDMEWALDGKILRKRTVEGEPAGKVSLILKTMGDTAEETILELTEDRLLLLDKDGETQYDWRKVMP